VATLTVGQGEQYKTIQAAINAAGAGDTIVVFPGTYHEQISVNKTGLYITAHEIGKAVVDGRAGVGGVNNGLPAGNVAKTAPGTGKGFKHPNLVNINADNVIWNGINVIRSMGAGIGVFKANNKTVKKPIIRNCQLDRNQHRAYQIRLITPHYRQMLHLYLLHFCPCYLLLSPHILPNIFISFVSVNRRECCDDALHGGECHCRAVARYQSDV